MNHRHIAIETFVSPSSIWETKMLSAVAAIETDEHRSKILAKANQHYPSGPIEQA